MITASMKSIGMLTVLSEVESGIDARGHPFAQLDFCYQLGAVCSSVIKPVFEGLSSEFSCLQVSR